MTARSDRAPRVADLTAVAAGTGPPGGRLARLNDQLAYALERSPHYRRAWPEQRGRRLGSVAELAELPFTTPAEVCAAHPDGMLAVHRRELARYTEWRGPDGRPAAAASTAADLRAADVALSGALAHHFGAGDLVFVAVPYELSPGAFDVDRALTALGAAVVPVGALSPLCPPARSAAMLARLRPTGLATTPDRSARLAHLLTSTGTDPAGVGLRRQLFVGGAASAAKLHRLDTLWGATSIAAYGSPLTHAVGLPCAAGALHLSHERYVAEVLVPDGDRPVPAGQPGELVLTTLAATAMPLLRYRTGDLVSMPGSGCACGGAGPLMTPHGPVADRLRLPDGWLTAVELDRTVLGVPGTGLFHAVDLRGGVLRVLVDVEAGTAPDTAADASTVADAVGEALRDRSGLACAVRPADRDAFLTALDRVGRRRLRPDDLEVRR